jgi:toxin ParE1/3/4
MSLPIRPLPAATSDITELYCYFLDIEANLGERFLDCLYETYEMIAHMPELGQLYRFRDPAMQGSRIRQIKKFSNYLIFYRIETDRIEILRVLHGARDYMNLFDVVSADE